MTKDWFKEWFNTPYYHQLYNNRNEEEAALFVSKLVEHLNFSSQDCILDLACGKGRHSVFLNQLGFCVWGMDLSTESIAYAKQFENQKLHFKVHDMRKPIKDLRFSHVLNLFTSFGYFESEADNLSVLQSVEHCLLPNGIFVLDFFNVQKIIEQLPMKETITKGNIQFFIEKKIEQNHIVKYISFEDKGKSFHFTEKVQALGLSDFIRLFDATKLQIMCTFGDFNLGDFDERSSDRLIIVAKKRIWV
jgi:SAM-dependent methyltransferase